MDPSNAKGQTALEYLLIVVVAIIVVVAVMVWMRSTTGNLTGSAGEQVDRIICISKACIGTDATMCEAPDSKCGGTGACCKEGMCVPKGECS